MNPQSQGNRPTAADICRNCTLSPDAQGLLQPKLTPDDFASRLEEKGLYADALRVMAQRLEKRAGIWWASLCLWEVYRARPPESVKAALQVVVKWVHDPSETTRRAAEPAGMAAGMDTPAGQLALAVFATEGSIAPPGLPSVAPSPLLAVQLAGGAVLTASYLDPGKMIERQQRFLKIGRDVLTQRVPCPPRAAAAPRTGRE